MRYFIKSELNWKLAILLPVFSSWLAESKIYKGPAKLQFYPDSSVLNLRNRTDLIDAAIQCCSSMFSAIFLEFPQLEELERFLNSERVTNLSRENNPVKLVLSIGKFDGRDWELRDYLSKTDTPSKLLSKHVSAISLKTDFHLCPRFVTLIDRTSLVNETQHLRNTLQQNNIPFGLEPPRSSDYSDQCHLPRSSVFFQMFKIPSFIVVTFEVDAVFYTFDRFSNFLKPHVASELARIRARNPDCDVIFRVGISSNEDNNVIETFTDPETLKRYKALLSTFILKFVQSFKDDRVKAMSEVDSEVEDLNRWINSILQKDDRCCDVISDDKIIDPHSTYNERKTALEILAKDFTVIHLNSYTSEFWEYTFSNLTTMGKELNAKRQANGLSKVSIIIECPVGNNYDRGQLEDLKEVAENLTMVNKKHPGFIKAIVLDLPPEGCDPYHQREYDNEPLIFNLGMLKEIKEILKLSNIQLGMVDCEPNDRHKKKQRVVIRSDLSSQADFIGITDFFYHSNFDLVNRHMEKVGKRMKDEYPDKKVLFSSSWGSNGDDYDQDCAGFKLFWELVRNWGMVNGHQVVSTFSFDTSPWFKQLTSPPFSLNDTEAFITEIDDTCVIMDDDLITGLVNISISLSGVTLNLNMSWVNNISTQEKAFLFKLVTLRFNVVEVIANEIQAVTNIMEELTKFQQSNKKENVDLYVNLNNAASNTQRGLSKNGYQRVINATTYNVRGVHFQYFHSSMDHTTDMKKDAQLLKEMKSQSTIPSNLKLGYMFRFRGQTTLNKYEIEIVQSTDYIILDANLMEAIDTRIYWSQKTEFELDKLSPIMVQSHVKQYRSNLHNIFQRFRGFRYSVHKVKPNMTVMLRLRWPSIRDDRISTGGYLEFWKYASEFALAFNFPFFVYQAFEEDQVVEGKYVNHAWWQVLDFKDLANASVFVEKESKYFRRDTPKPKLIQVDNSGSPLVAILVPVIVFIVILILVIVILYFRLQRKNQVLSRLEVRKFLYGYSEQQPQQDAGQNTLTQQSIRSVKEKNIMECEYNINLEINKMDFRSESSTIIGNGAFGIVFKTIMPRFEGDVAVKMPKTGITKDASTVRSILAEIKVMSYIGDHDYVLKILGAYTKEIQNGVVYVVTEYCDLGSLVSYLRGVSSALRDRKLEQVNSFELNRFCQEISIGMEYISSKHVVHGDLSARNVLLTKNKTCKISDFGLSRKLEQYELYQKKGADPLPWRWMAIESLQRLEFTVKSDVWSCGVTFWEVYSLAEHPFPEITWDSDFCGKLAEGLRLKCPKYAKPEMYKTMLSCWENEPKERPSFRDLSIFFRKLNGNEYFDLVPVEGSLNTDAFEYETFNEDS